MKLKCIPEWRHLRSVGKEYVEYYIYISHQPFNYRAHRTRNTFTYWQIHTEIASRTGYEANIGLLIPRMLLNHWIISEPTNFLVYNVFLLFSFFIRFTETAKQVGGLDLIYRHFCYCFSLYIFQLLYLRDFCVKRRTVLFKDLASVVQRLWSVTSDKHCVPAHTGNPGWDFTRIFPQSLQSPGECRDYTFNGDPISTILLLSFLRKSGRRKPPSSNFKKSVVIRRCKEIL